MGASQRFYKILALEIVAVLTISSLFFLDTKTIYRFFAGETHFSEPNTPCNLHLTSCEASLKDGSSLTFSITPNTIPLMEPLTFNVTSKGIDAKELHLRIFATNMDMGVHQWTMKQIAQGHYEAQGILPTCIVGSMIWRAEVIHNRPTQSLGAVFTFQTE